MRAHRFLALGLVALAACNGGDDPTGLGGPCTDDTGSVSVTVTAGTQPTFDWDPDCAVALVLVEGGGGDVWGVTTDDNTWGDPVQANLIAPPVAYGVVPANTDEFEAPAPLVAGTTYEVILWRVPPGGTAGCAQVVFGACLLAVHEFTP